MNYLALKIKRAAGWGWLLCFFKTGKGAGTDVTLATTLSDRDGYR